ncbi:hypothetical protein D9Q98_002235 [Chlorella vulgaris]|uniref:Uncharacterized protein n=1 Tax=Chlorella vulgaris TaxID=3077 RepID=A0A9D4TVW0_CHLVU|nr:hypothetical protein D9Q98_002235 [Chlorella vulgaris]
MWNRASSTAAQWQTALLVLVKLAAAYGTMLAPEAYWRRRNIFAPMIRFGFHLLPVVREQGVGAGLVLETAARPGVRGAIQDLARLLGGMRQLGAMVGGLALLLPPAVTLCTQSILLLLVSNTETYCERPLLEDPLTQQRLSGLATGLEYATLPVLVLQPLVSVESPRAAALLLGEASASSVCRVTLSFIQVAVVVLLPTLVAVYFWEGPQAEQEEAAERAALRAAASSQPTAAAAAAAAAGSTAGTPAARGWRQGWRGAWYRLMDRLDQVAAAANRALYCALHSPKLVDSRTLAVPWLLATLWWLCKCAEGLH